LCCIGVAKASNVQSDLTGTLKLNGPSRGFFSVVTVSADRAWASKISSIVSSLSEDLRSFQL
jgi:hypothetical protein